MPETKDGGEHRGAPKVDVETTVEHIPTREEVRGLFERMLPNGFAERRVHEDEQGLCLWEVEISGEKEGETIEYSYIRKGKHAHGGSSATTSIHIVWFESGEATGGHEAARLIDGAWVVKE